MYSMKNLSTNLDNLISVRLHDMSFLTLNKQLGKIILCMLPIIFSEDRIECVVYKNMLAPQAFSLHRVQISCGFQGSSYLIILTDFF